MSLNEGELRALAGRMVDVGNAVVAGAAAVPAVEPIVGELELSGMHRAAAAVRLLSGRVDVDGLDQVNLQRLLHIQSAALVTLFQVWPGTEKRGARS